MNVSFEALNTEPQRCSQRLAQVVPQVAAGTPNTANRTAVDTILTDAEILALPTSFSKKEAVLRREEYGSPSHWKPPRTNQSFGIIRWLIFTLLCIMSFGHANLDPIWAAIILTQLGDETAWDDGIKNTRDRLNNVNLVVSACVSIHSASLISHV
jgi:hypothetical protein